MLQDFSINTCLIIYKNKIQLDKNISESEDEWQMTHILYDKKYIKQKDKDDENKTYIYNIINIKKIKNEPAYLFQLRRCLIDYMNNDKYSYNIIYKNYKCC